MLIPIPNTDLPTSFHASRAPTPIPKPNEVLIRVIATTVSAGDWRARSLTMPKGLGFVGRLVFGLTGPRKPILGTEFSGIIEKIGSEVSTFQAGDTVIGFPGGKLRRTCRVHHNADGWKANQEA